ncbi:MAG: hypothetical protein U0M10_03025, partial [Oscillospiraceae bacterium]|nr:hypothetical protein [Oscillospiraceae bacterium]
IIDSTIREYYVNFLQSVMEISKKYQFRLLEGQKVAYCGAEKEENDTKVGLKMPLMKNLRVFLAKNGENNVCGKNPLCLAAIAIINKNIRK